MEQCPCPGVGRLDRGRYSLNSRLLSGILSAFSLLLSPLLSYLSLVLSSFLLHFLPRLSFLASFYASLVSFFASFYASSPAFVRDACCFTPPMKVDGNHGKSQASTFGIHAFILTGFASDADVRRVPHSNPTASRTLGTLARAGCRS